jgi:beta-galactosidase GanA
LQWRQSRRGAEKFHSAMVPQGDTDTRVWREVVELGATVDALSSVRGTRTVADVRHAFSKHGGNMGEEGSVGWMFKTKGVITLPKDAIAEDALFELVTENGAEDFDAPEQHDVQHCHIEIGACVLLDHRQLPGQIPAAESR